MHVSVNSGPAIPWDQFARENEGLSEGELAALEFEVSAEGYAEGGGGAVAPFTIEKVPAPPPFYTVAVYKIDMAYGGPEEGGWWYQCGERVDTLEAADGTNVAVPVVCATRDEAEVQRQRLEARMDEFNKGRRPISSVLSEGVYDVRICDGYAEQYFPATKPHYE